MGVVDTLILKKFGRSLGCGIVEYKTRDMALDAISQLTGSTLQGRKIRCREDRARSKEDAGSSDEDGDDRVVCETKVFVNNLSWTTTEEELITFFCAVGHVVNVELKKTRNGRSRGSAIVEFSEPSHATAAINNLN